MERAVHGGAGANHRPHEAVGHRTERFRQANLRAQRTHTIVEDAREIRILRDNMPFGRAAHGEFGTYFVGYSRPPHTIEQMLENTAVGTGHLRTTASLREGVVARQREVKALVELHFSFELDRQAIDNVERGANDSDWQPAKDAARQIALAEDSAIFEGYTAADIVGIRQGTSNPKIPLPADVRQFPDAIAQELHIGQGVSIGYLSHTDTAVRLYLQETFTFLLLTGEAAVALIPSRETETA